MRRRWLTGEIRRQGWHRRRRRSLLKDASRAGLRRSRERCGGLCRCGQRPGRQVAVVVLRIGVELGVGVTGAATRSSTATRRQR
eukprot:1610689-Pleurochrysis_carterae.AAC.1